jgi:AcrR family transcriptional regulator
MQKRAPEAPRQDLRELVLRASVELIDEQGLEALSMREVARRANVSHQAPYHHFADREAILAAICERGFEMLTERIKSARASADGAFDQLEAASVAYVEFACEHSAYFRVMFRPELVHKENYPKLMETADCAYQQVPHMLAACMKEGLRVDPDEQSMALALWSMVHGCACLLIDGPLEKKVEGTLDRKQVIAGVSRAFRALMESAAHAEPRKPHKKKTRS